MFSPFAFSYNSLIRDKFAIFDFSSKNHLAFFCPLLQLQIEKVSRKVTNPDVKNMSLSTFLACDPQRSPVDF